MSGLAVKIPGKGIQKLAEATFYLKGIGQIEFHFFLMPKGLLQFILAF